MKYGFRPWIWALAGLLATSPALAAGAFHDEWRARVAEADAVEPLAQLALELFMEAAPTGAGPYGIHGTPRKPTYHDDRLPDVSGQGQAAYYNALGLIEARLAALDEQTLSSDDRVDRRILAKRLALRRLELGELAELGDPFPYTQVLGASFSDLVLRDYAPLERRLRSFGSRCEQTPLFLTQAEANLLPPHARPPAENKRLALASLAALTGETGLLRKVLPELLAKSKIGRSEARQIRQACDDARDAIDAFAARLREAYAGRPDGPWRLGAARYARKYELYLDYPLAPQELLREAERALEARSEEMVRLTRKIHDTVLADEIAAGKLKKARRLDDRDVVRNVLAKLAEDRSTVDTLIADSYALADRIVGFVNERGLMDLPPTTKLRIENIPSHMSGRAVAMISTAPPFEPQLESVWFWDLPLLAQAESYLKEYCRAVLAEVYIHEGVPGHFVQLEYSNRSPRLVPRVFYNGALVEGWASYIESQMVDQGFTIYPDRPFGHELQKVANLKLQLRAILNAVIDIRLHTTDWPEEEALRLMMERGFQEEGEARGKLVRAKLSSVQLASYFAGHRAILEILDAYRRKKGDAFTWKEFNERLVGAGSPPFDALRERMLAD